MIVVLATIRKDAARFERTILAARDLTEAEKEVELLVASDPELEFAELHSSHLVPAMNEMEEETRLRGQRERKEGRFAGA